MIVSVLEDLEVVIKTRDLEHLDHRQTHLRGQRNDVPLEQGAVMVVENVQVLDQKIAPMAFGRGLTDQGPHLGACFIRSLPPLELCPRPTQCILDLVQVDACF